MSVFHLYRVSLEFGGERVFMDYCHKPDVLTDVIKKNWSRPATASGESVNIVVSWSESEPLGRFSGSKEEALRIKGWMNSQTPIWY